VPATAAVEYALGGEVMLKQSRSPAIMADAAYAILNEPARKYTGQFPLDDEVLSAVGVTDFEPYSQTQGGDPVRHPDPKHKRSIGSGVSFIAAGGRRA
jgi:hypothetical protein